MSSDTSDANAAATSATVVGTVLAHAEAVGDAVLYEGYLLYPYRASAKKNQFRWQWGVLMPPGYADDDIGEYATASTECLLEPQPHTTLHLRLRFLHAHHRAVRHAADGTYRDVDSLRVGGLEYTSWDEAVEREVDVALPAAELFAAPATVPVTVAAERTVEQLASDARLVRTAEALTGTLRVALTQLPGPFGGARLQVSIRNTTDGAPDTRDIALRRAFLAAHVVLALDSGHFLSVQDPPEWARPATDECRGERLWPVLLDAEHGSGMLASPIILSDDPAIAPESNGPLFDGTEIDEILTLRTMALTGEEKRQARATDPKAAQLIDRADNMPAEMLERLHGTVRYLREATGGAATANTPTTDATTGEPDVEETTGADVMAPPSVPWWDPGADTSVSPDSDTVTIAGAAIGNGSPVTLRPGLRRSDAQDMFLAGRHGTVRAVLFDVDDCAHLAVTLDDDPAADLYDTYGRYHYFTPEEIEPDLEVQS